MIRWIRCRDKPSMNAMYESVLESAMYPIPVMMVPPKISGMYPNLSRAHPVIGPRTPFSALARAKASDVCQYVIPSDSATGMKKTANPCQTMVPPKAFIKDAPARMYQP